jgi:hypothetical protein
VSIAVQTFEGLPGIFAECVDPECVRYNFGRPWLCPDGRVYGTDSRILVRTPEPVDEGMSLLYAPTQSIHFAMPPRDAPATFQRGGPWEGTPTPMPDELPPETIACKVCKGSGVTYDMDWHAEVTCGWCDGEKIVENLDGIYVGSLMFAPCLLHVLHRAGVRSLFLPVRYNAALATTTRGAYFAGPGFEGVVAPMTPGCNPESN